MILTEPFWQIYCNFFRSGQKPIWSYLVNSCDFTSPQIIFLNDNRDIEQICVCGIFLLKFSLLWHFLLPTSPLHTFECSVLTETLICCRNLSFSLPPDTTTPSLGRQSIFQMKSLCLCSLYLVCGVPLFVIVHRYVLYNRWIKIQCYTILDSQARSQHNINHDIVQLIRDVFLLEMCPVFLFESNIHILIARKEHIRSCQHKLLLVVFFPFFFTQDYFHTGLFSHMIIFVRNYLNFGERYVLNRAK